MKSELLELERLLADALTSADPVAVLELASKDPSRSASTRAALSSISADGVRISALIIARLRFERLIQGSKRAVEWFESNPREFAATFKLYHRSVVPHAAMPVEEAQSFETWLGTRGDLDTP